MSGTSRGGGGQPHSWRREAERFRLAAIAYYVAALPLAGLALHRSRFAWFLVGAVLFAGLCCERGELFARRMVGLGHE